MAKFKVGDRVKILLDGTYGTIDVILDGYSCGVIKGGEKIGRYYPFCYLELVEPKKEGFYHPSYEHEYLQQYEYDPIDGVYKMSFRDIDTFKNRIPDNVFFNDKKKATTLMFGKEATVVKCGKDDEYSRRIGFLEAYFQATCGLSKTKAKKYLENIVKD